MCLLMKAPANTLRHVLLSTPGLLESMFSHNEDGYGVMYGTANGPKVIKKLPKSAAELRKLVERLPQDDRMVAMHLRMRTHGDISIENTHPYAIAGGGHLMHNGVLSFGNAMDATKSDTWHYCRTYLDEGVDASIHEPEMLTTIGQHIGSNVFAIMTDDGQISLVNAERGIEREGVFFSNLYAWDPAILDPALAYSGWMYRDYGRYGADEPEMEFAYAIAEADVPGAERALGAGMLRPAFETLLGMFEPVSALDLKYLDPLERKVLACVLNEDAEGLVRLAYEEDDAAGVIGALALAIEWRERDADFGAIDDDERDPWWEDEPAPRALRLHEMTDDQYEEMYAG